MARGWEQGVWRWHGAGHRESKIVRLTLEVTEYWTTQTITDLKVFARNRLGIRMIQRRAMRHRVLRGWVQRRHRTLVLTMCSTAFFSGLARLHVLLLLHVPWLLLQGGWRLQGGCCLQGGWRRVLFGV